MTKKAIILLSGGLDSATCLAIAKRQGFECYALSFAYGQRHNIELVAAGVIAKAQSAIQHKIITLPVDQFVGSALTDRHIDVPDYDGSKEIPVTYVPARNTIFLAFALGWAEVIGAHDIFYGANSVDYSHYPDCRPEYIQAFQQVANLATKDAVNGNPMTIHAPLALMPKSEIIKTGTALKVDFSQTISCYRADLEGRACGTCDSCTFRKRGFKEAGIPDTTRYQFGYTE